MAREEIYWRTEAGLRAWASPDSGLPAHYRRILGLLRGPTHVAAIRAAIKDYCYEEVFAWLDELDTLGFVQGAGYAAANKAELPARFGKLIASLNAA